MFKKIMSLMLAVLMLMSVAMIAASAAQVEIADNSADAVAEVAADAAAETGATNTLTFDVNSAGWKNFKTVYCHIWIYDGDAFYAWQAKGEKCDDNGDGTYTYDLDAKNVTIEPGKLYAVIFSNNIGMQTYNLLFDSTCLGDTAYCDGTQLENPEDSQKTGYTAYWKGQDAAKFGPELCITSIGNVVGTCLPSVTSSQAMFVGFLQATLANAKTFSGKDDQTLIDDTAKALGLKVGNVEEAIAAAGVTVDWDASKSSLAEGTDESAKEDGSGNIVETPDNKKNNNTNDTTSSKTDDTTNTTNNNNNTSNNKTGSGSTTQTGQNTTLIFVMIGVMIAAAAAIIVAKKRDRA